VVAVEPHPSAIEACRRHAPGANVVAGDVSTLADVPGLAPSSFDVVGAFDVIEHLQDDVGALEVMRSYLRADGRLVVTVPALQLLWGPHDVVNGHHRRYSRRLLEARLRRGGFEPTYVSYFNMVTFPAVAGVRVGRRVLRREESDPGSDFELPAPSVNEALTRVFGFEGLAVARWSLPIGSSLVAVARPR